MASLLLAAAPTLIEPFVRYPDSASAPRGIYLLTYQEPALGTWVVACLPPRVAEFGVDRGYLESGRCDAEVDGRSHAASEVLKRIAALPGDQVTVSEAGIVVNGHLLRGTAPLVEDSQGRPLTAWSSTGGVVPPGYVWLFSDHSPRSWDSRYYGPVPLELVRSSAVRLTSTLLYAQ